MKAEELRLWNFIFDGVQLQMVEQIEYEGCYCRSINGAVSFYYDYENLCPIPITEQWLIDFGFAFTMESGLFNISGYDVMLTKNGIDFYLGEYGSWYKNIEYVHQLQNLYFALTGEELQLKQSTT